MSVLGKIKAVGGSIKESLDRAKEEDLESQAAELIQVLREKMAVTGVCPVCCTLHKKKETRP